MKREDILPFKNKTCFIRRKNGYHYRAEIVSVSEDSVLFLDKFQTQIALELNDITEVSEWRE